MYENSAKGVLLVTRYRFLPIFRTFLGDVLLPCCYSYMHADFIPTYLPTYLPTFSTYSTSTCLLLPALPAPLYLPTYFCLLLPTSYLPTLTYSTYLTLPTRLLLPKVVALALLVPAGLAAPAILLALLVVLLAYCLFSSVNDVLRDHFSRIDFPPLLRKGGKRILEKRLESIPIKK